MSKSTNLRKVGRPRAVLWSLLCAINILSLASLACSRAGTKEVVYSSHSNPAFSSSPQTKNEERSQIRNVDFNNFDYPGRPIYSEGEPTFKLRDGRYKGRYYGGATGPELVYLTQVAYGDVTGDSKEEAILVLFENVRGSAIPYYVYIYTLDNGKPRLLWAFRTGDRGDGGLRQTYAENGELVIDLYGKNTVVEENLEDKDVLGACCPKSFTRSRYKWDGKQFLKDSSDVLPNPLSNAELLPLNNGIKP